MLDAIADFWKPAKKIQSNIKLEPDLLQVGSSLGFGFVPQAMLSGRRLHVIAINTYQFGEEKLTSFVLSLDKDPNTTGPTVSMIVAESEGEYYLAISRRISLNDRAKLFDSKELENIIEKSDAKRLACNDNVTDLKGWVVSSYKREIQGLRGNVLKGDFRKTATPANSDAQNFEYTLLVSENNEHAIEIEKYSDGRFEIYATVYRRMGDVGEITHPVLSIPEAIRPDVKIASAPELLVKEPAQENVIKPEAVQTTPIQLQEFAAPEPVKVEAVKAEPVKVEPVKTEAVKAEAAKFEPTKTEAIKTEPVKTELATQEKTSPMSTTETTTINGAKNDMSSAAPKLYVQSTQPESFGQTEIKAVSKTTSFENDSIECDLRVANKIIDEAIRNEMRLTDIVRRIIELPVANPESVQIPLTLSDEDYALLAIRYGISASDRNAIKRRIISDLGDFSGEKKKAA